MKFVLAVFLGLGFGGNLGAIVRRLAPKEIK